MSLVPWHATAAFLEDVDFPYLIAVEYGKERQYFTGVLRTFDKYGNLTLSEPEECIFYNGFMAKRPLGKILTVFGESVVLCGRYDKSKSANIPKKSFGELEKEYKQSVQF
ncbi:hypothetical protein EIN_409510 [Entamoeba invadens IP1]|uniref:LSM domain-containing protein n=1 Tax=Entamoeba invadens IP1 TaxID=370355 RepID=A0A0A1TWR4_ENTIV|nr:hypothetical protein EIN_409510 [Entamoeba invadens IP1]ELP85642.1 hypothetical protein EIN_409510 [Entamoeba invadens IP1]|eukprot:XP_004184988.1 hypothetical protein EIN_409510 [Entamoeba invadens IP1]